MTDIPTWSCFCESDGSNDRGVINHVSFTYYLGTPYLLVYLLIWFYGSLLRIINGINCFWVTTVNDYGCPVQLSLSGWLCRRPLSFEYFVSGTETPKVTECVSRSSRDTDPETWTIYSGRVLCDSHHMCPRLNLRFETSYQVWDQPFPSQTRCD